MRLQKIRIQNYRSIIDTGEVDIEQIKTILVGPNEAGKTAILQALQQINPPKGTEGFNPLRDYPRSLYNDISTGKAKPDEITVVEARFALESTDKEVMPEGFKECTYVRGRHLDNSSWHRVEGGINTLVIKISKGFFAHQPTYGFSSAST